MAIVLTTFVYFKIAAGYLVLIYVVFPLLRDPLSALLNCGRKSILSVFISSLGSVENPGEDPWNPEGIGGQRDPWSLGSEWGGASVKLI